MCPAFAADGVDPGGVIFRQGERAHEAYMVAGGSVRIVVEHNGVETVLATLSSGQVFGEMALFDGGPRSATAIAGPDGASLRRVTREQFDGLLADPFLRELVREMAQRLRAADALIAKQSVTESARHHYLETISLRRDWSM